MVHDTPPSDGETEDERFDRFRDEAARADERVADDPRRPRRLWVFLSGRLEALEEWLGSHGGRRLRAGIGLFWTLIAVGGVVLLVGPVINPPLSLDDVTASAKTATDRWIARDFAADYTVTRGDDGRLTTHVQERIDAFFPEDVDESGIERVLATDYEGHALAPSSIRATLDGNTITIGRSETPTRVTLSIDAGHRLEGDHDIVIDYDLHDLAYPTTDEASGRNVDLLQWDVFGPSWAQGFAGLDVTITLPKDLDDRLIRQPRGELAWLIIGDGAWLTPEADSPPGQVTYEITADQNIPPHANAWFTMSFEPGTFTMPPHPALWWVQTFGPIAPLLLLALSLLLAIAARRVAWGDAHGRPWFVAQYDPPDDLTPQMAAQVTKSPRALELASSLQSARTVGKKKRPDALRAVARIARRTGRLGDRARALALYLGGAERRGVVTQGLRRIPRGFVRDSFIGSSLALTLVQWGLVRQLSHQVTLAVVWWPVAFVLLSSAVAIVVLAITLSARPLTRKGALARQYLLGIALFANRTRLLERTASSNALLPYAVLLTPAREAGSRVLQLIRTELSDPEVARGWRTPGFLTVPRLLIRIAAPVVIAAAIVVVATVPAPTTSLPDYATYDGDVPGTLYSMVTSARIDGTLSRTDDGRARIAVTESLGMTFDDSSSRVPQFAQQWTDRVDGQSLDLTVDSIRVDGSDVPFTTEHDGETLLARTTMADVLTGDHSLEIAYTIGSAAIAADSADGVIDRVRWAALLEGWNYATEWGDSESPVDPLSVSLTVPDDLTATATSTGWLAHDFGSDTETESVAFGRLGRLLTADDKTAESQSSKAGSTTHTLRMVSSDGHYPYEITSGDLGAVLDFPSGTFTGPDAGALQATKVAAALPPVVTLALAGIALLVALVGILLGARRRPSIVHPGALRDLVRGLGPAVSVAAVILFGWTSAHMYGDEPLFVPLIVTALASPVASIVALVLTRRARVGAAP